MLIHKKRRDRYAKELGERFASLRNVLDGRQAEQDDAWHGAKGKGKWSPQTLEDSVIINELDLHLAIDDFLNILKEIRKQKG